MSNLIPYIKALLFGHEATRYEQDERITMEPVEALSGQHHAQVRGVLVPITGLATVTVGEQVAVAWKKGIPVAVIKHHVRWAQFHDHFHKGGGIVEQLLVANLDNTANDVWYRNQSKCVKVLTSTANEFTGKPEAVSVKNHPSLQGMTLQDVKWGLDGKSFMVQCTGGLYVGFRWNREDANKFVETFPDVATVFYVDRPLESMINLTMVSYTRAFTKSFYWYVAKCAVTWGYKAVQSAWYDGSMWYWYGYMKKLEQDWETTATGQGSAAVSTSKSFPLKTMLTTGVRDWYNDQRQSVARASVQDWYLDELRNLKFLIKADWDYFWVGTNAIGHGQITYPWGRGPGYKEGYSETLTCGGGGLGCIGAKRQSDHQTVPETHYFLYNATTQSIPWASCDAAPSIGSTQYSFSYGMWEHEFVTDPGYSSSGLPDPHMPGWDRDPSNQEGYYLGANWSNLPVTNHWRTDGIIGREGSTNTSSTGTFQLFRSGCLPCMTGPYVYENMGGYTWAVSMLGLWTAWYCATFQVRTQGASQLYHYRMQTMQMFSRRIVASVPRGGVSALGLDEALFFVVVERYPFISGTGYINELPMLWIGIVTEQGQLVKQLRAWSYGYAGAELISGNGHHVVWCLLTGALDPHPTYYVTNLDSGDEHSFTNTVANMLLSGEVMDTLAPNDISFFTGVHAKLMTPEFLWSNRVPEKFFVPGSLPVTTEDKDLEPYAHLSGGQANGSTRIINDQTVLLPLGKWQAA
jgi:hypothetical protein